MRREWARALWSWVGEKLPEGQVSAVIWRAGGSAGWWWTWGEESAGGTAGTEPSPRSPVGEEVPVEGRHLEATAAAEGHRPATTPRILQRQSVKQAGQEGISSW